MKESKITPEKQNLCSLCRVPPGWRILLSPLRPQYQALDTAKGPQATAKEVPAHCRTGDSAGRDRQAAPDKLYCFRLENRRVGLRHHLGQRHGLPLRGQSGGILLQRRGYRRHPHPVCEQRVLPQRHRRSAEERTRRKPPVLPRQRVRGQRYRH